MSDVEQYANYFRAEMKVGVGIPLPNAEVFRDWAWIHALDQDLVSLQLSRDQLPIGVALYVGQIIEVRAGQEGNGYSCRAIIVSEAQERNILLRLIGEVVSDELREFYRIDAFLPIKFYRSAQQNADNLVKEWETRRGQRQIDELSRKERRWEGPVFIDDSEEPLLLPENPEEDQELLHAWQDVVPLAANISGGGIRIATPEQFELGEYVLLEILIPGPQRIIDAVVKVVFTDRIGSGSGTPYYSTAMKFVFIDERDRDAIIHHISSVQLLRIKQLREKYAFQRVDDDFYDEADEGPMVLRRIFIGVCFAVFLGLFFMYLKSYMEYHPKNEIAETFEGGIRKYLERFRK